MKYKTTRKEKKLLEEIKDQTGFDVVDIDDVATRKEFFKKVHAHLDWLVGWAEEQRRIFEARMRDFPRHFEAMT
jgi:hypothetical protein